MELPDELWKIVKDYQIDHKKHHHKKLKIVHDEMMNTRHFFTEKIIYEYSKEISDNPNWDYFHYHDFQIDHLGSYVTLKLHGIAISSYRNDCFYQGRYINFYYGWSKFGDVRWNFQMNYGTW